MPFGFLPIPRNIKIPQSLLSAIEAVMPTAKLARMGVEAAPTNIKTYAGTMLGDRSPITEKNFKPAELELLRKAVKGAQARRAEEIAHYRRIEQNAKKPNSIWGAGAIPLARAMIDEINQQEKLVDYDNYAQAHRPDDPQFFGYPDWEDYGWGKMLQHSLTDPEYNLNTTLGRARYVQDAQGNLRVEDTYDFNKTGPGQGIMDRFAKGEMSAYDTVGLLFNPKSLGNILGTLLAPESDPGRRQVNINLGKIPADKVFAEEGRK